MKELGFLLLILISFFFDIVGFIFAKQYAGKKLKIFFILLFSNILSIIFPMLFWMFFFRADFHEQFFSLILFLSVLRIASFFAGSGEMIKELWKHNENSIK